MLTPIAGLLLMLAADPLHAAAPPPMPPEGRACDAQPARCEQMRKRHEAWCRKHPELCEEAAAQREAQQRICKRHPDRCADVMAQPAAPMEKGAPPAKAAESAHGHRRASGAKAGAAAAKPGDDDFCARHPEHCRPGEHSLHRSGPPR